jgi:hypothetical protein
MSIKTTIAKLLWKRQRRLMLRWKGFDNIAISKDDRFLEAVREISLITRFPVGVR